MTMVTIISVVPVTLFTTPFLGPVGNPYSDQSLVAIIVLVCIFGPLFETAVFQSLPIHGLIRITKLPKYCIIAISAALFSVSHYFNLSYIVVTFVIGVKFAYAYTIYLSKKQSAFLVVSAIHMLRNFVSLTAQLGFAGAG
jgi:hypothetical protein